MAQAKSRRRFVLVGLPLLLVPSTSLAFVLSARSWGDDWGYLVGFLFYWAVWCYLVPFLLLGRRGLVNLFKRESSPLLRGNNRYLVVLLLATIIGAIVMYFIPNFSDAHVAVVLLAIPIAMIAGTGEEILWRGLYIRFFPKHLLWAYLYPTLLFALQHISSQLVEYSASSWVLVVSTLPLGLAYGLVAYRIGSIRWNAVAHIVIAFLAFGAPVSTSVHNLLN